MTTDSTPTNHLTPQKLDRNLAKFTRWAAGDLTGNRMRGLYAEWMIASQLGVLDEDASRVEWDMVDIRYKSLNIEVKTSGNRQQWSEKENQPRFSIARRAGSGMQNSIRRNRLCQQDEPLISTSSAYTPALNSALSQ